MDCRSLAVALILLLANQATGESIRLGSNEITLPADWRALPSLSAGKPDSSRFVERFAFGDPSAGCYLLVQKARVANPGIAAENIHDALLKAARRPTFKVSDYIFASADSGSVSSYSFEVGSVRGRTRTRVDTAGETVVVSCFWTPRAQELSEPTCQRLLEDFSRAR